MFFLPKLEKNINMAQQTCFLILNADVEIHLMGKLKPKPETSAAPQWTFLTNHTHVLICIARDPEIVLKEVAILVGITERAVQRIVSDLEEGGYIEREKVGRRNRYVLKLSKALRHPIESNCNVKSIVDLIR